MNFFKKLFSELLQNGKLLIGYVLMNIPFLTDYPMILDALEKVLQDPSEQNLTKLMIQIILAGAAGHRILKILAKVLPAKVVKLLEKISPLKIS
jgi:hypothetical protein